MSITNKSKVHNELREEESQEILYIVQVKTVTVLSNFQNTKY